MEQNDTMIAKPNGQVSKDTGLTAQQEKCAILLASGIKITDVAEQIGTSRGTLYRWQNLVAFQCFYNLMKQDIKNYVEGSVLELHTKALKAIGESMESNNEQIRLKASMWVIDKIQQIEVGNTDVRRALMLQGAVSWNDKDEYERRLKEAGLRE